MTKMKTDQLMEIAVGSHTIKARHGTMMVDMNDILNAGNAYRVANDKGAIMLTDFMRRPATTEYVAVLAKVMKTTPDKIVKASGIGRGHTTYGHINFALYMAQMLNTELHVAVNQVFIEDRMFQLRDDGGYLNIALRNKVCELPDRLDKDNSGMCTQVNIKIKANINPTGGNWNTATAQELNRRVEMENFLIRGMDIGFIDSKEALWKAIEKF